MNPIRVWSTREIIAMLEPCVYELKRREEGIRKNAQTMKLIDELIAIRNYVGKTIDDDTLFICEHSLIEWIDEILSKVEDGPRGEEE